MLGAICKSDVLRHPAVTIQCFGWKVFLKALFAGRNRTFLSILLECGSIASSTDHAGEIIRRSVDLELRAKRLYESLADQFADRAPVKDFFQTLARQEQHHAELLEVCRAADRRQSLPGLLQGRWNESVARLERQMRAAEAKLPSLRTVAEAVRFVVEIESSEVNHVFRGIVSASESPFVQAVQSFRNAGLEHLAYIDETAPAFDDSLQPACELMLDGFRSVAVLEKTEGRA